MHASPADSTDPRGPNSVPEPREDAPRLETSEEADERVERMSMDSFPASDPPSSTLSITTQGPVPPVRR
jgi:hypothetical protein